MIASDLDVGGLVFSTVIVGLLYSPIWLTWLLDRASKKR
jgi:hypothetical protein